MQEQTQEGGEATERSPLPHPEQRQKDEQWKEIGTAKVKGGKGGEHGEIRAGG